MKLIFFLQIITKVFYKLIVSLCVFIASHAQSTQNNKFAISWQYLKKNMKDEDDFFLTDKRQRLLQIDSIILDEWPGMLKSPKITSLLFLCIILRKKWVMKLIFCMQISMKVSYKLILLFLMGLVKHSQSSRNSKFAMSLQNLKKEVWDKVDYLHANKHQCFLQVSFNTLGLKDTYKVILSLLMSMVNYSQSTQNNKFAISLQYIKKKLGMEFIFLHADKHQSWDYRFWWNWPDMSKVPKIGSW